MTQFRVVEQERSVHLPLLLKIASDFYSQGTTSTQSSSPRGHIMTTPHNVNPIQWQQNVGLARQACARIFRDGGTPHDALQAFQLPNADKTVAWNTVVDRIAASLAAPQQLRKAA